MTLREQAEMAAKEAVPCSCSDAYRDRNLTDPTCAYCDYDDQIADAIERVAKEHLRAWLARQMQVEVDDGPIEGKYTIHMCVTTGPGVSACFGDCGRFDSREEAEREIGVIVDRAATAAERGDG